MKTVIKWAALILGSALCILALSMFGMVNGLYLVWRGTETLYWSPRDLTVVWLILLMITTCVGIAGWESINKFFTLRIERS
jgi:hypothetical protein